MAQYTFRDIEEFLLDDDFFQWARYGFSDNGFDIESYKLYVLDIPDEYAYMDAELIELLNQSLPF